MRRGDSNRERRDGAQIEQKRKNIQRHGKRNKRPSIEVEKSRR